MSLASMGSEIVLERRRVGDLEEFHGHSVLSRGRVCSPSHAMEDFSL